MEVYLLYLFAGIAVSIALYPLWIRFVYRYQMGEQIREDGPKTHLIKSGTPTMGGMVFVVVVAVITILFNRSRTQTIFPLFIASMAGLFGIIEDFSKVYAKSGLPSFLTHHFGFIKKSKFIPEFVLKPYYLFKELSRVLGSRDDKGLQSHQKFIIQGTISGFIAYWTYFKLGWDYIWFPLVGDVHIGLLYPVVIFVLFLAILNFVAFTDGVDGLAGGLSLFAFMAFWFIAAYFEYKALASFCSLFVGALIPFLYFNVYPARIFMGNVGSHVLGATLALLGVLLHREVAMLIILAVFIVDGASSPLQSFSYKLTKKRIFLMAPLHHHFELSGWPESKVTFRFWLIGILAAFIGVFVALL